MIPVIPVNPVSPAGPDSRPGPASRSGEAAQLPPALAGWSASLAALTVNVAAALGPMLLRLDELVGRHQGVEGPDGEPDGFSGLARRGSPERLLIGEWLLAEEIPAEFLRRAASGELLHLATARRHDPPHGVVRVLADTGPGQLGGGRLVQLAALIVLHRRAASIGAALQLGVLGRPPGDWLTGDLPELLRAWLPARSRHLPGPGDVLAWLDHVDTPGTANSPVPSVTAVHTGAPVWLLCSPELAAALPSGPRPPVPGRRTLTSCESGWDADGARTMEITLAGERVTLTMPTSPEAVRALRGQGFRRAAPVPARTVGAASDSTGLHHPAFPGSARRLVGRGTDRHEVVSLTVPGPAQGGPSAGQPKRRRFPGTVLGAGVVGARLVILHAYDDLAEIAVVGKNLAGMDRMVVPLAGLDLDPGLTGVDPDGALAPLLYDAGVLLCRLGDRWYRIHRTGLVDRHEALVAAIASEVPDSPQRLFTDPATATRFVPGLGHVRGDLAVRLGHGWVAWAADGVEWELSRDGGRLAHGLLAPGLRFDGTGHITVADGGQVLGVVQLAGVPGLVTASPAGLVLRLAQASHTRTLTRWSSGRPGIPAAVHPTAPLIAVVTADGGVKIADLSTDRLVQRLAPPS